MAGLASEGAMIEVEAAAPGCDVAALHKALGAASAKLAAAGAAPPHMSAMVWRAPDPASIHPARRDVDRARREVFAGFRPPLRLERAESEEVRVAISARIPAAKADDAIVFAGYTRAQLATQMSPRGQVPDMGAVFAKWTQEGAAARARLGGGLDIAYGPHRDQVLDLYRPAGAQRPPVWVFIHGGYWQASTKDQHAQFCTGMVCAGFAVANIDYALAPETPLARIVEQVRAALWFLVREADNLAIDAARLHVSGHSAGGHLSAFMACDPLAPPIVSAHPLSGVFDLESLMHIPMGRILGLDTIADVERLSPNRMTPRAGVRTAFAVGGAESDEFKRQSAELARAWGAPAPLIVAGANHFTLPEPLAGGDLLEQAKALCAG
ncbi:MAG: alpha/beta hydrolase [Beijerinckiaceae bacterium]|nr:alpha/beta hydrolase [Beijerinckiaceae bacterium]